MIFKLSKYSHIFLMLIAWATSDRKLQRPLWIWGIWVYTCHDPLNNATSMQITCTLNLWSECPVVYWWKLSSTSAVIIAWEESVIIGLTSLCAALYRQSPVVSQNVHEKNQSISVSSIFVSSFVSSSFCTYFVYSYW